LLQLTVFSHTTCDLCIHNELTAHEIVHIIITLLEHTAITSNTLFKLKIHKIHTVYKNEKFGIISTQE